MIDTQNKPLAAKGLISYRYPAGRDWVMIGAKDDQDALNEAQRSLTEKPTIDKLERWNGEKYERVVPQA